MEGPKTRVARAPGPRQKKKKGKGTNRNERGGAWGEEGLQRKGLKRVTTNGGGGGGGGGGWGGGGVGGGGGMGVGGGGWGGGVPIILGGHTQTNPSFHDKPRQPKKICVRPEGQKKKKVQTRENYTTDRLIR